jgi:carboxylesterase type B
MVRIRLPPAASLVRTRFFPNLWRSSHAKLRRLSQPTEVGKYQPTETDLAVQRRIVGYWTRIAKTDNPNGSRDPQWSPVTAGKDTYLEIGAVTATKTGDGDAHCDFWDGVPLLWPHI